MIKRFRANQSGNVAMMTSIAMIAVLTGVAAAVDINAVNGRKNDIQNFADSAVLAAAQSGETKKGELRKIIKASLDQNNKSHWPISFDFDIVDGQIELRLSTEYDTMLMGLAGKDQIGLSVNTAAPISGQTPINLSLVLDTTDSMSGHNIGALKTAATTMVETFEDSKSPVAISVVPFGQYVNIGLGKKNENWLDVFNDGESETREVCWDETREVSPRVCTNNGITHSRDVYQDGRYIRTDTWEGRTCTGGDRVPTGNRICEMRTTHYKWHGCVGSRQDGYNLKHGFESRRIPGMINRHCGTEMLELTTQLHKVKSVISSLKTSGNTYLPGGIMWGWRSLEDADPLTKSASVKNSEKDGNSPKTAMVIMTDGMNTLSQNGIRHEGSDRTKANAHTLDLCAAVKASKIEIYTIGYRTDDIDEDSKSVIRNCASSTEHAFTAKNASDLKDTFKVIADRINTTRLIY